MYSIVKTIFFRFNPEQIHHFVMKQLFTFYHKWPFGKSILKRCYQFNGPEQELWGIKFKNPVGLAAGFDKNAEYIEALDALGFGFIEVGTVTPKAQPGNEQPRMFRLTADEALINRMGFNNKGVDVMRAKLQSLKRKRPDIVIGGNIGKNKVTPNEDALNDYLICFRSLFDVVDYFVVNVSSPNTPDLRALQDKEPLMHLLHELQQENQKMPKPKPILLKIAPDLNHSQLDDIVEIVTQTQTAGVIATNTTIDRAQLQSSPKLIAETGGLSGKPLTMKSTEVIKYLSEKSNKAFPIIGVGGIHSAADAQEKIDAGASLVQLYTGFIYEGPSLIGKICKHLKLVYSHKNAI